MFHMLIEPCCYDHTGLISSDPWTGGECWAEIWHYGEVSICGMGSQKVTTLRGSFWPLDMDSPSL